MTRAQNDIEIYNTNPEGLITVGRFNSTVPTTAGIFAPGCILVGPTAVYTNAGTTASPSFQDINTINSAEIADSAVTAAKLATDAVETAKIKNANVTADKLASNAVTTAKITDANVTLAKLAAGITASHIVKFFVLGSTITTTALVGVAVGDLVVTILADGTVTVGTVAVADTLPADPADTSYVIVFRAVA